MNILLEMVANILTKAVIGFRSKMEDEYFCRMVETAKPALVCLALLFFIIIFFFIIIIIIFY